MKEKTFWLPPEAIKPGLAAGRGSCIATDLITVQGNRVGFMYREAPDNDLDSGWRFFAGSETQEYLDNPEHLAIYDVNTIANYDPEIIPLLDSPHDIAFERDSQTGDFVRVDFPEDRE